MAAEKFRLVQDLFSPRLPQLGELYVSTLIVSSLQATTQAEVRTCLISTTIKEEQVVLQTGQQ